MRVPPGLNAKDFADAIREFQVVVGTEWVFTSDDDLDLYRDAYSPFRNEPEELIASAAVAPESVEDVQHIVRIANRYGIPLYTISTGRNLAYGGAAPSYSGSVVLDLKRMNRIIEVNERNAYCVVEPGVSYFDLYRHLQAANSRLWLDVPHPGWGSLVGNALDNGGGITAGPYRNHFEAHCGMEVVLANGEILRTGMGAMPGVETWQQYKYGYGPYIDGLFKQANLGIVTKMGFWLMPEPEAFYKGSVLLQRHDDIVALVDTLNYLENTMQLHGADIFSPAYPMGPIADPRLAAIHDNVDGPDPAELQDYVDSRQLPFWGCALRFYGAPGVVRALWEGAKEKLSAIPGAVFKEGDLIKLPLSVDDRAKISVTDFGIPSLAAFALGARSDSMPDPTSGHLFFTPIIPRSGAGVIKASRVIRKAVRDLGLPTLFITPPMGTWPRAFLIVLAFPIYEDIEANRKLRASVKELYRICADHGWGEYRTGPAFMDTVLSLYSYNDHILRRFNEAIKDALDPKGILSPGRYGIWPRHLRKDRP